MTTTKTAKTYTYQCSAGCGTEIIRDRKVPADTRISCHASECDVKITRMHNEEVEAYRQARQAHRAANPRQARTAQPLYGDFAQLASFNGVRTDGTGRRVR